MQVSATGITGLMIVNFKPWALQALFGLPAREMQNRSVDLQTLWPVAHAGAVGDAIAAAADDKTRLGALIDYVLSGLPNPFADRRLQQIIYDTQQSFPPQAQARTLRRRFDRYIGVSPKQFARLRRFQRAAKLLRAGRSCANVAAHTGFYDQSHMGAEFRAMLKQTPRQFASANRTKLALAFQRPSLTSLFHLAY